MHLLGGCGAGGYAKSRLTYGFAGTTITIGASVIGVLGAAGNSGGTTYFGGAISAGGDSGGTDNLASTSASFAPEGNGGVTTGGNIVLSNGAGGFPGSICLGNVSAAGRGGGSALYLGGYGSGTVLIKDGYPATQQGCGGANSGPSGVARTGGLGYAGLATIYELS
jgi:hypothetical protein